MTDHLSHEQLESLAEDAEEYLYDLNIELVSHSYANIISQAVRHGFLNSSLIVPVA